ncbi:hypothetical phage protein [Psychrobacter phage Psymv2]|uniref:hypothetical protein n=1 Tax=Psychrobacter phage Psymv2 TaxID=1071177 RepID=UPI00022A37F1|nr:hypothetical protein CJ96_gp18 [Psychrobacter phage Psymv2]AEO00999.1 hypothetical phage protein [Psychrobacter phage Psymv2]
MTGLNITADSEWLDKKGELIRVLSVDNEKDLVEIEWPNNKKRAARTVSVQKFLSQVVPIDRQPESAKEKSKPGRFTCAWIDELPNNFGQSPNLQLSNQDWLEQGMHAKTVKFNIGAGGLPPEVNWEDHCAAIAMIDDKPARALASILLWGSDTHWDWSRQFDEVVMYLAAKMVERCKKDGRAEPQACSHTLPELARLMARMILHFELYELWDDYTVKGRLRFSGIEVNVNTYSHAWLTYQRQMVNDLFDMVVDADHCVSDYRQQLAQSH